VRELGPVSQAILDYMEEHIGYIAIFSMIHRVSLKTGTSHTSPWYFRRLVALALEGRIEARVFRTGDDMAIKFRQLQEEEVVNSVVEIEQVQNGYIVMFPHQKDETFFDSFDEVISYLKFCFNMKEEAENVE